MILQPVRLRRREVPDSIRWYFLAFALLALAVDMALSLGVGHILSQPQLEANPVIRTLIQFNGLRGYIFWIMQEVALVILLIAYWPTRLIGMGWSLFLAYEHIMGARSWIVVRWLFFE